MSDGECVLHVSAGPARLPQVQRALKLGAKYRRGVTWTFKLGTDEESCGFEEHDANEEGEEEEGEEEEEEEEESEEEAQPQAVE